MYNKKYRVGVVGTGTMGRNHLRVVNSIPGFELTCAADISEENLNSACAPFQLKKFTGHKDMVDLLDAVMVSAPTENHHSICKYFLENKKHVLVEKPFTTNLEQADELIALAEKEDLVLAVGHLERFNPVVQHIRDMVKKPLFIEIQRLGPFSPRSLDVDVIMDLMIHDIDIILQWDHSGIKQVNASGIPIISKKIDIATVRLEFNSGLVANITASRVSQKKTRKLRIFQKNQYFSVDYKKKRAKIFALANGNIIEDLPEIEDVEPLMNLWNNFYKTLTTGKNYNVTGVDGRNALKVALEISGSIDLRNIDL
ncbi:MAG: Gfo/Idh/MocA family oxidoreductase [Candidatus Aminicenantes bacterium]|nr:Gfo/Idh/MocA family oxidoreductase [Candidatus Aminicenantes bacterium]